MSKNTASTSSKTAEKDGLSRLLEKQLEDLDEVTKKIELWTQYKKDYVKLKDLIETMKDKVRHNYRVPIAGTQLAFVKGHIIHTNELFVLLGDNYFALRSSNQAGKIIKRRLEVVDDNIKKNQDAKKKTEDWLKSSQDYKRDKEEFVEIIETM